MTTWQPYREPMRVTLLRTGAIALFAGLLIAWSRAAMSRWLVAALLTLWPSLGGHFVELWFLNWLRPRLSDARAVQVGARIGVWFAGGAALTVAMGLTATAMGLRLMDWRPWWIGGLGFIGIELVAHLVLHLRGWPNFYNGRG